MTHFYTLTMILSIFSFALASTMTPGPNNIMLLSSGLTFGYKRTLPHALGVNFGFPLMVVCVYSGDDHFIYLFLVCDPFNQLLGIGWRNVKTLHTE